jgi:hypothetical protein
MGLFSKSKTHKSEDNIDTLPPVYKQLFRVFCQSIELPFSDAYSDETSEIEYQSRDGFIAYDSTRGGSDRIAIVPMHYLTGSGEVRGLACQSHVEKCEQDDYNYIKENNPEMTDDEISEVIMNESSEQDDIAYRVRILYKGEKTIQIDAGFDYDAPYFRWSNKSDFEADFKYKNLADLKMKLKKIRTKIMAAQYTKKTKTKKAA